MRSIGRGVGYAALAAILSGLGVLPASANTYDVTFVGANFDVNAVITTLSTPDSSGGYDITNIQGSVSALNSGVTGGTITGLATNPLPLLPLRPKVPIMSQVVWVGITTTCCLQVDQLSTTTDRCSVSRPSAELTLANLYSVGTQFYLSVDNPTGLWNPGDPGRLQVSATPVPAALPLFAAGLGVIGLLFWRSKRKATALTAA